MQEETKTKKCVHINNLGPVQTPLAALGNVDFHKNNNNKMFYYFLEKRHYVVVNEVTRTHQMHLKDKKHTFTQMNAF